jgi:hypothetical protein
MIFSRIEPSPQNQFMPNEAQGILDSYHYYLGKALAVADSRQTAAQKLYQASFALVAHDTSPDPLFVYANQTAQTLFEMSWLEITSTPSRQSAEPGLQEERQALLNRVLQFGYLDDYAGIRISKTGKRFWIKHATVWNLIDSTGSKIGQAACFDHWDYLAT